MKGRRNLFLLSVVLLTFSLLISCGGNSSEPDNQAPTDPAVLINDGDAFTFSDEVELTLSADDNDGVAQMKVSADPDFTEAEWQDYQELLDWEVAPWENWVYALFRDASGNVSDTVSDNINYYADPTGGDAYISIEINDGDPYTASDTVTLTISSDYDISSGEIRISNSEFFQDVNWVVYQDYLNWVLDPGDGLKNVYAQIRDRKGNISGAMATDDIYLAATSTVVRFEPDPLTLPVGSDGVVTLLIEKAQDMASARFVISFDPTNVAVTDLDVAGVSGHILQSTGASIIVLPDTDYDNTVGRIVIGALALQNGFTGVSGDGPFAEIRFRVNTALDNPVELIIEEFEIYNYPVQNPPTPAGNVIVFDGSIVN